MYGKGIQKDVVLTVCTAHRARLLNAPDMGSLSRNDPDVKECPALDTELGCIIPL